jgi:hypothetical protein
MGKLTNALAMCALGMQLAVAAQDRETPAEEYSEHEQHVGPSAETPAGQQSMGAMHEHMLAMRAQMARIHATEDPAERQRLMNEHMQSMQQTMHMMGATHGQQQRGSGGRCAADDAPCRMDEVQAENRMMRERMGSMEGRLESMQQLMREMMDHLDEVERPR